MAKALGKGLNSIFGSLETTRDDVVEEVNIQELRPNPYQPRKIFSEQGIEELKDSILQHGIIQPIIVKRSIKGYQIVVGERRYRAAKLAGLTKVPVVVKDFSNQEMMELAVLENLQREDLTPIEEAFAYQTLLDKLELTQEELAKRLGKSRPHITNHIRLLSLPGMIQDLMNEGKMSMGHGRALLGIKNKELLPALAAKVIKDDLNVRQLEKYIHELNESVSRETVKQPVKKDVFIQEQENVLRERLGTTVTIKQSKKKGKIEIEFFSTDDLNRILELLDKK
ncbi:MAG: ParB/RepB/Spo0J family partition protein [Bacillus sp. (in: firmicutes)]